MKKCKTCNVELVVGENIAPSHFKNNDYKCKLCKKGCNKQRYSNNKEKVSIYNKQYNEENKDGHFSVYLLPDHNYVGKTCWVDNRMSSHKNVYGRNTDNVRVLYTTKSENEALELEALLHDMGYEGKSPYTRRNY